MDKGNAQRLTSLFNGTASSGILNFSSVTVSMSTAFDTHASFTVPSPSLAARYVKLLENPDHPLFERAVHRFPSGDFLDPIVFKVMGRYRRPDDKLEYAVTAMRLRFSNENLASELCFNERFSLQDSDSPDLGYEGPTMKEFIRILEKAGDNWSNMDFNLAKTTPSNPNRLKLVHTIK